jgi:hypothetical protein
MSARARALKRMRSHMLIFPPHRSFQLHVDNNMFGTKSKPVALKKTYPARSEEDEESWDETRAETVNAESFSLFGFNLFESEATLQVNRSVDSRAEEEKRGFFQRLWEGPTDNNENNEDSEEEESDSDDEDEEEEKRFVPPKRVGVSLQRAPPFHKNDDASESSMTASLGMAMFASPAIAAVAASDRTASGLRAAESKLTTESKRRFWNRKNKLAAGGGQGANGRVEQPQLRNRTETTREQQSQYVSPSSSILQRIAAEKPMFRDGRDDNEDARRWQASHERFTYEPEGGYGRDEQELFKCFPTMNLASRPGMPSLYTGHHQGALPHQTFQPRGGNMFNVDPFSDAQSKRCFPSWPSPVLSFEVPSDLTNSTDGIEATEYVPRRKSRSLGQSSRAPSSKASSRHRVPTKQVNVSSSNKKRQLHDLLAKYQQDQLREYPVAPPPPRPISLPAKSKSKSKARSHRNLKQSHQQGSWDEHSGWFTLGSLDVM